MFGHFREKNLKKFLTETRYIKVKGFEFVIKKINVMNYLEGNKILLQSYDTYTNARLNKTPIDESALNKKLVEHYTDVICSGVVAPKIVRKPTDDSTEILVDVLFNDMEIVNGLYEQIIEHTYGKKKLKRSWLQGIK